MRNIRLGRALFIGYLLGFLLLVLVIAVPAANAQCNDPDIRVVMGPVCRQNAELRGYWGTRAAITRAESVIGEFADYGNYAAGAARAAAEYGYRDVYGRQMGRREKVITGAAIGTPIGAAIGSLKNHPGTGALFGAGGGALIGLLASRGSDGKPVDCSKRKLNRKEQETCSAIAAEQQAAIVQQQVATQQAEAQRLAQKYYNQTGRPVDVKDAVGNLVADIPNGGSVDLPESPGGYRAYMRLPAAPGKTTFRLADQRLAKDGSGFVFIFPVEGGV